MADIQTPIERLREIEQVALDRSALFGATTGALFRIAQGVADPRGAALAALRAIGADELAALAASQSAPGHTDLMVTPESLDAYLEANPPPEDATASRLVACECGIAWCQTCYPKPTPERGE